jgi:hypothetical protein
LLRCFSLIKLTAKGRELSLPAFTRQFSRRSK